MQNFNVICPGFTGHLCEDKKPLLLSHLNLARQLDHCDYKPEIPPIHLEKLQSE